MNTFLINQVTETAAETIRKGGLVAFPTETVYGLGGNALDPEASAKIYAAKGRPSDNPLIVHICDPAQLDEVAAEIPEAALRLAEQFWPGPMTMVLKKKETVPYATTGGLDTVAVRFPENAIACELIRRSGVPIAAPSANTSGRPSPTTAAHVLEDLNGRIDGIIDGGSCEIGVESTIIDLSGEIPTLLRPGKITIEELRECIGRVEIDPAILRPMKPGEHPKAPGMKYRHYAPKASLTVVRGEPAEAAETICALVRQEEQNGRKCGIIATEETKKVYPGSCLIRVIGSHADEAGVRRNLFAVLREFDAEKVDRIFSEAFTDAALMNRLSKAAGYDIREAETKKP